MMLGLLYHIDAQSEITFGKRRPNKFKKAIIYATAGLNWGLVYPRINHIQPDAENKQ